MTTQEILKNAILNKKCVAFDYHSFHRVVEPHHYGSLKNTLQLHAYQQSGGSKSGGLPQWRNFKISEIENIQLEDINFTPRSSYRPSHSHYSTIDISVEA